MKLGVFIVAALILINLCTCVPSDIAKVVSYDTTMPPREIHDKFIAGTDGRNGPPSNDHQCPLGTYPNCQGKYQNTKETSPDFRGN
ncbi:hypothetical protein BS78_06G034200 [Paspalum vaginatum]|nr:hypothetical protein BS78_06G034200 [Paspalum vaginatum]